MIKVLVAPFFLFLIGFLCISNSFAEVKSEYGADFRFRYEYWENVNDLGILDLKNENYFRLKTSLWGRWDFGRDFGTYLKISNESKYYMSSFSPDNRNYREDEIYVEHLFLDITNAGGLPVDMRIGRQDLQYGNGLLIWDGTPVSGDRCKYFNAVKTTWRIDRKNSIDFVLLYTPKTDTLLPTIHPPNNGKAYQDHRRILNTSNSAGAFVYGKTAIGDHLALEPYYIFKREGEISSVPQNTPQLDLHTIGARVVYNVDSWKLRAEAAHQFGEYKDGTGRRGNGGNIFFSRQLENVLWKPEFETGFLYLSGDDPYTKDNEGWDPLFSRWPGLSRLYLYTIGKETGINAYWTNLELLRVDAKINFSPRTSLTLFYNYLWADKDTNITNGPSAPIFSNSGKDRGQLLQGTINHGFAKNVDSLLMMEYFIPGNFYSNKADNAFFLRFELQVKI